MKKEGIVILVLFFLLVGTVGFIIIDKYIEIRERNRFEVYQQGAQFGYEQAVAQLFQQAITCQQIPVIYQNQTVNMIAVECLQPVQ